MKDQKKIRLGLIGVGNWALFAHVRVLRLLPEYEIVTIYSQRKRKRRWRPLQEIMHSSRSREFGCVGDGPIGRPGHGADHLSTT